MYLLKNKSSLLDTIRAKSQTSSLIEYFENLLKHNENETLKLINDKELRFCTLFLLKNSLEKPSVFCNLNLRNQQAIKLINEVISESHQENRELLNHTKDFNHSTLKWIFETGFFDDGLCNKYDDVLDKTAILLVMSYRDNSILPVLADMIFNRYNKGLYIHDLVWAFYQSRDPRTLIFIACRLRSKNLKDVELARKILGFIPGIGLDINNHKEKEFIIFLNWIEENHIFLEYTRECYQQTPNPIPYETSLNAKYLCKDAVKRNKKDARIFSKDEHEFLKDFKDLKRDIQILLSNCSFMLYRYNLAKWNEWIHFPIEEQIKIAKAMSGGAS